MGEMLTDQERDGYEAEKEPEQESSRKGEASLQSSTPLRVESRYRVLSSAAFPSMR